jgi:hypothetical protein
MNANQVICGNRANETRLQVEALRRKLIRDTERYLSNPFADSWARLGDPRLSAKKLQIIFS